MDKKKWEMNDTELNIGDIADNLREIAEQLKKLNKLILDISSEVI